MNQNESTRSVKNFLEQIIDSDLEKNTYGGKVATRFPPEPNGYLHIGHAKSICLNFGLALKYQGTCNLRFDDTNPTKEEVEYMESIKRDVSWLGFKWNAEVRHASDYFPKLYDFAIQLIQKGLAYVCDLSADEMREYRGTLTEPGRNSPYRNRSVAENLDLFERMKKGEFADGSRTLRAKIDMSSGNISMRDPALYRIRKVDHYHTGSTWCVYPMYDFAHCLSDAIEDITHSICTLEFIDQRALYDWILDQLVPEPRPHQYEFARLNMDYSITSKRKLKALVDESHVRGWDDPRMLTLTGLRRRGYTPAAIRLFCERIGVSKKSTVISMSILEDALRDELNQHAPRVLGVLDPVKVVLTNFPEESISIDVLNHPQDESKGSRTMSLSREIYIERDDYMENPPKGYFRLSPGAEVRLRHGYIIKCERVEHDKDGNVTLIHASCDLDTLGKKPEGRKVKGIIHWVDAKTALNAEVRVYDRLFNVEDPTAGEKDGGDFRNHLNPDSLRVFANAKLEASLADAKLGESFQFERQGYFTLDPDSQASKVVFNRAVTLRDSWVKTAE